MKKQYGKSETTADSCSRTLATAGDSPQNMLAEEGRFEAESQQPSTFPVCPSSKVARNTLQDDNSSTDGGILFIHPGRFLGLKAHCSSYGGNISYIAD